ncbi:MAG: cupredoxin domain-containing protein [Candidatus Liptonbacteria bacterium]|nr:cupredoxin domain-containing protein [Candidatus Liptonbacteria bacterium]
MGSKSNVIVIVVAVAVMALLVVFGVVLKNKGGNEGPSLGDSAVSRDVTVTREPAPANVFVPSAGAKNVPANVAVPKAISKSGPLSDASYRSFTVAADGGRFMPDTVIVKQGDTVDLNITAVDGDYDFTQPDFGFKTVIAKATTQNIQFQATATGRFAFYCSLCGGPSQGPLGYIVVVQK